MLFESRLKFVFSASQIYVSWLFEVVSVVSNSLSTDEVSLTEKLSAKYF